MLAWAGLVRIWPARRFNYKEFLSPTDFVLQGERLSRTLRWDRKDSRHPDRLRRCWHSMSREDGLIGHRLQAVNTDGVGPQEGPPLPTPNIDAFTHARPGMLTTSG